MRLRRPIEEDDHVMGPPNASIILVQYGDFECPFCGETYWELKQLSEVFKNEARFAFRHFPLTQMHPNAMLAAEAAEAAGAQGKFWEMHDMLYTHQQRLDAPALLQYAAKLGLDLRRFRHELQAHTHAPRVRRDFLDGVRSGVNGTPSFFINGNRYAGPFTAPALLSAMEEAAHAVA
jgi:protein-disulfide isomerase